MPTQDTRNCSAAPMTELEVQALREMMEVTDGERLVEATLENLSLRRRLGELEDLLARVTAEREDAVDAHVQGLAVMTMLRRRITDLEIHNQGLRMLVVSLSKQDFSGAN